MTCPSGIGQKYLSCVAVGRVRLTLAQTIAFEQLDHVPIVRASDEHCDGNSQQQDTYA